MQTAFWHERNNKRKAFRQFKCCCSDDSVFWERLRFSAQTFIKMTKMQLYPLFSLTVCICRGKGAATIQLSGCSRCAFIDHSRAFIPWKPPQEQKRFLICKAPYARNTQTFCSGPQMLCMNGSESVKFSFLLSVSQFLFPP